MAVANYQDTGSIYGYRVVCDQCRNLMLRRIWRAPEGLDLEKQAKEKPKPIRCEMCHRS